MTKYWTHLWPNRTKKNKFWKDAKNILSRTIKMWTKKTTKIRTRSINRLLPQSAKCNLSTTEMQNVIVCFGCILFRLRVNVRHTKCNDICRCLDPSLRDYRVKCYWFRGFLCISLWISTATSCFCYFDRVERYSKTKNSRTYLYEWKISKLPNFRYVALQ